MNTDKDEKSGAGKGGIEDENMLRKKVKARGTGRR